MQFIHTELKNEAVTLFPIPFPPLALSEAFAFGTLCRTEIAIQVALSNAVKKIRENMHTPVAQISTQGEAIKINLSAHESDIITEVSLWHLNRFDDFEQILATITNLLGDIGVEWKYAATVN